jgi:hypothetical protein
MREGNDPSFAALRSRARFANILATVHPLHTLGEKHES